MSRSKSALVSAFALGAALTVGGLPASASEPTRCEIECGPAPCCMFLWVALCGCPWAPAQTVAAGAQAATSCTQPEPVGFFESLAAGEVDVATAR